MILKGADTYMDAFRLKELRKLKKATQDDVAKYLGISRPAYTAYEAGKREPDDETKIKLANYFNVTVDYLLGGSSEITDEGLTENQKLIAYSIDPDITDEEREAIIEMVKAAKKFKRRI